MPTSIPDVPTCESLRRRSAIATGRARACLHIAREIAARIQKKLGGNAQLVLVHVMAALNREQLRIATGGRGVLGSVIAAQTGRTSGPMKEALGSLGTVDVSQLPELFRRGMGGQPAEATKLLRAEFERTQKILALQPWPKLDDSPSGKGRFDGLAFQFDMAMSLAAVNPTDSEARKLAYEMALYARTRNSEVERELCES